VCCLHLVIFGSPFAAATGCGIIQIQSINRAQ
jgi:hypothetical protein